MRRYWTREEDEALTRFVPYQGRSLRDLARELGRTYYATRLRRKALLAGHVTPGGPTCDLCSAPLKDGRRHGHCEDCRTARAQENNLVRYKSGSLATRGVAQRKWSRWTAADDAKLLSEPLSIALARDLGRTLKSCSVRRQRVLSTQHASVMEGDD